MNRIVLDSSAVLARFQNEPGGYRLDALLDDLEAGANAMVSISSVNWCEILTRMQREFLPNPERHLASMLAGVELIPFGKAEAEEAARIAKVDSALSLGDRACLALARTLDATAWTTDQIWARHPTGAKIELLR